MDGHAAGLWRKPNGTSGATGRNMSQNAAKGSMHAKIIAIEERSGPHREMLERLLRMVPDKDRDDKNLLRLLAFRVQSQGESATAEFIMQAMREKIRGGFAGGLYAFLMASARQPNPSSMPVATDPPDIA